MFDIAFNPSTLVFYLPILTLSDVTPGTFIRYTLLHIS